MLANSCRETLNGRREMLEWEKGDAWMGEIVGAGQPACAAFIYTSLLPAGYRGHGPLPQHPEITTTLLSRQRCRGDHASPLSRQAQRASGQFAQQTPGQINVARSEERRVGKECRRG